MPATLVIMVVVAAVVLVLVGSMDGAVRAARADAVADVVALGAVSGDRARAEEVARIGGAHLVELRTRAGGGFDVTVELDGTRSRAAAAPVGRAYDDDLPRR